MKMRGVRQDVEMQMLADKAKMEIEKRRERIKERKQEKEGKVHDECE